MINIAFILTASKIKLKHNVSFCGKYALPFWNIRSPVRQSVMRFLICRRQMRNILGTLAMGFSGISTPRTTSLRENLTSFVKLDTIDALMVYVT